MPPHATHRPSPDTGTATASHWHVYASRLVALGTRQGYLERMASAACSRFESCPMKRQVDTETTIIVLSLAVVYLAYVRIIDWMPELGLIGNLATADVSMLGGVEVKYHSILMLCALAICWAILLKVRRASRERSLRDGLSRHGLSRHSP